jgi:hypothetical protein
MMALEKTDGFKVLATWSHQGMIVPRRSRNPAQFAKFDYVSGWKGHAPRAKSMTADERKVARSRWLNR